MKIKYPHIVFLFFFWSTVQFSQNYQLEHFGVNNGLPHSKINTVAQDSLGYLWVGTNGGGIAKFDGLNFSVLSKNDGLISDFVTAIYFIDKDVYIGTRDGLTVSNNEEKFNYSTPKINSIISLGKIVYIATNKGIRVLNNSEISLVRLNSEINNSKVYDIVFDNNNLWMATSSGLWYIEYFGSPNQRILKVDSSPSEHLVLGENSIYFSSHSNGVFYVDLKTKKPQLISTIKSVKSLFYDTIKHELFCATEDKKLVVVNEISTKKERNIQFNNDQNQSILANRMMMDRHNVLWIASNSGLYKLTLNGFKHYLQSEPINAVKRYKKSILTASSQGRLVQIDSGKVSPIKNMVDPIYTIEQFNQNTVFAGANDAIYVLDSLKVVDTIAIAKNIQKILITNSTVWVASSTEGITRFMYNAIDKQIDSIIQFGKSDGVYDLSINDIAFEYSHKLWYVTSNGMLGYIENDIVHHLGVPINQSISISSLVIHNGKIYLGTLGEGIWYATIDKTPKFKPLIGNTLKSNNIYQLMFSDEKTLWIGTQIGVERLQLNETNEYITSTHFFGKSEGFTGVETMTHAIEKDHLGNIWSGTIQGLTTIERAENKIDSVIPKLNFTKVEVGYTAIDTLNYSLKSSERMLRLKPQQNQLTIAFQTVDIHHPDAIAYRWKLNNAEWSSWSANSEVVFAQLNPGFYSFRAQSRTANGKLSVPIELHFTIDTAFVDTLKFKVSLFLLILLLIIFFFWRSLKSMKKKSAAKQHQLELENKLLILEQKALRLQMNPHFIFNVLNGIKALGNTNIEQMNTTIQNFSKLLRATLNNSRQETISLEEEISSLEYYMTLEQQMTAKPFEFKISVAEELNKEETLLPPMLLQPFVENSIQHGISKIESKGIINIDFTCVDQKLYCTIQDNGIGFKQSQKQKPKSGHQSMALKVTKERIRALYGTSSIQMEEIVEENGSISGTKITVVLPLLTDF